MDEPLPIPIDAKITRGGPAFTRQNPPACITVVEKVYHQPPNEQPTVQEAGYNTILASDDQPYTRPLKLSTSWKPLDHGWIESASLLLLRNTDKGGNVELACTPESDWVPADKLTEALKPQWLLEPGQSMRCYPADISKLLIRSNRDGTRSTVVIYPK